MEVPLGLIAGARVLLQGLNSRHDLNGREAELLSGPHHESRWAVRIITTGECIRVKPANFHRSPGLHTHLNSDALALVLKQCCGRSLRALCATDQAISALAKAALAAGEWRWRIDAERLKEWKASSPVYGFFSLREAGGVTFRPASVLFCMSQSAMNGLVAFCFISELEARQTPRALSVELWDARRGVRLGMHKVPAGGTSPTVALSADGRRLALGYTDAEKYDAVQLFEIGRDGDSCTFTPRGTTDHAPQLVRGSINSIAWSTGPRVAGELDQPHFLLCAHGPHMYEPGDNYLRLWRFESSVSGDEWRRALVQELTFGLPWEYPHTLGHYGIDHPDQNPSSKLSFSRVAGCSAFTPAIADGDGDEAQCGCDFAASRCSDGKILLFSVPTGNGEPSRRTLHTRHRGGCDIALMPPIGPGRRGMRVVCMQNAYELIAVWSVDTGACIGALNYRAAIRAMPWFNSLGRYERENYGMPGPADPRGAAPEDGMQDLSDDEIESEEREYNEGSPIWRHVLTAIDVSGAGMLVTGDQAGCLCVWDLRAVVESSPSPGGEDRRFAEIEEEGEELNAEGGFAGRPSNILLVAVNPPGGDSVPFNDSPLDEARLGHGTVLDYIYGVAIVETDGEDVAGGGIVFGQNPYPTDGGRCKWTTLQKIRPVDKTDMLNLG